MAVSLVSMTDAPRAREGEDGRPHRARTRRRREGSPKKVCTAIASRWAGAFAGEGTEGCSAATWEFRAPELDSRRDGAEGLLPAMGGNEWHAGFSEVVNTPAEVDSNPTHPSAWLGVRSLFKI